MKICSCCKRSLNLSEFSKYVHYGHEKHFHECISCITKRRKIAKDVLVLYERKRSRRPDRQNAVREYQAKNKDKFRIIKKNWYSRNMEKKKAEWTVSNAIRDKKMMRQPCEVCGKEKSQAHHDDYSKPLEVRWLCTKHHAEHHRLIRWEVQNRRLNLPEGMFA